MSALPRHLYGEQGTVELGVATEADLLLRAIYAVSAVVRDADDGLLPRIKGELKNAMRSKDSFASTVYRVRRAS